MYSYKWLWLTVVVLSMAAGPASNVLYTDLRHVDTSDINELIYLAILVCYSLKKVHLISPKSVVLFKWKDDHVVY